MLNCLTYSYSLFVSFLTLASIIIPKLKPKIKGATIGDKITIKTFTAFGKSWLSIRKPRTYPAQIKFKP